MKTKIITFLLVTVTSLSLFYVMEKVRFDKNKQKIEIVETVRILPTFSKKSAIVQKENKIINDDKVFESELNETSHEGYSFYNQRKPFIQRESNTFINIHPGENSGLNKRNTSISSATGSGGTSPLNIIGIGSSGGNSASSVAVINNSVKVQAQNERPLKNSLPEVEDLNISSDIADPGYENMEDEVPRVIPLTDGILILLIAALMYVVFINHRRIFYNKK